MSKRVVALDAAGTLLVLRHSVGAAYASLAAEVGGELDASLLESGFQVAFRNAPPLAFGDHDPAAERAWWRSVVREALARAAPEATFDAERFFDHAYEWFATSEAWRVPADVRPALRALRVAGHVLVVLSNWDSRLESLLGSLGVGGYFARVFVSSQLPAAKPDRRAFEVVAREVATLAGDRPPVMVGDRLDHDVTPALEAGWEALLLRRDETGGADDRGRVIRALTELPPLF